MWTDAEISRAENTYQVKILGGRTGKFVIEPDYPHRITGWHGAPRKPANVWAVAFREARPAATRQQFDRYRELLARYAREPMAWSRKLRYRLGRWICGSRPFAPYLFRERWETECHSSLVA